eukprot:COSAG05_NODE_898_length_6685_cov_4.419223_2_plen_119_part_00
MIWAGTALSKLCPVACDECQTGSGTGRRALLLTSQEQPKRHRQLRRVIHHAAGGGSTNGAFGAADSTLIRRYTKAFLTRCHASYSSCNVSLFYHLLVMAAIYHLKRRAWEYVRMVRVY